MKSKEYRQKKKNILRGINYQERDLFEYIDNSVVFIHIPKSAGISFVQALYGRSSSIHATALDYQCVDPQRFKNSFSFAVSRNPYTRLYSAYNYLSQGGRQEIDKVWRDLYLKKYANFEDFVINGLERAIVAKAEHFIPQYLFVTNEKRDVICSYLGKFEELDKVVTRLKQENSEISLAKLNSSVDEPIELDKIYNKKMIETVNRVYKEDFALFGYELM